jgi:hypothetical protein
VVSEVNPQGKTEFLISNTLLFGESAAVYRFNRVARALQRICAALGDLVLVNYFDDYPQLETAQLADSAHAAIRGIFGVLGWGLADGEKDVAFAAAFSVLGVVVHLEEASKGIIQVSNKPARVLENLATVKELISNDAASPAVVGSLAARVHSLESVHFGRCAAAALKTLRRFGARSGGAVRLGGEVVAALTWLAMFLPSARPRVIQVFSTMRPIIVFTDGACEGEVVSCGAVLMDGAEDVQFFGTVVPPPTCRTPGAKVRARRSSGKLSSSRCSCRSVHGSSCCEVAR